MRLSFFLIVSALAALLVGACGSGQPTSVFVPGYDAAAPVDATTVLPFADAGGVQCKPATCASLGFTCGTNTDGCGGTLNCGSCSAPEFCGGGGFSKCGAPDSGVSCVGTNCAALGYHCGPAGDGCGNQLDCGSCTSPAYCGGGGFATCGGNSTVTDGGSICVPQKCSDLGYDCGPADDGCGNLIECGSCTSPLLCGGGGQAGVCGNSACTGLCLDQVQCDGGVTTTITGTVVGGTHGAYGSPDPVPNVLVYVPANDIKPFATPNRVQCNTCGADVSGNPVTQVNTDYLGNFTLTNVPVPASGSIPIVIQLGRWRREITMNGITACTTMPVQDSDSSVPAGQIRMPRNQSEGDIPLTAISTGAYDALECVLVKMGVDTSEFRSPGNGGRIEMYQGNGVEASDVLFFPSPESYLTNDVDTLNGYDQVLFPCWGEDPRDGYPDSNTDDDKTANQLANLVQYTTNGGRVFATHYSYSWLFTNSPFNTTATWVGDSEPATATATIQQSPNEVDTFYSWMNALSSNGATNGTFTVTQPKYSMSAINANTSDLWIQGSSPQGPYSYPTEEATAPASFPLLYTFDTPVDGANQCGRVIFSSFHVVVAGAPLNGTFPDECETTPMSPQEKALEYLIWDLASCVQPPQQATCTPITCEDQSISCGPAGNGCGAQLDCGPCPTGETCGGGGVHGQCGSFDGGHCVPTTCDALGINCGPTGDGCGGLLQCGPCVAPETCGGGGTAGQCGYSGSCTPQTCDALGYQCGPAGDGCGGILQCGACVSPQTCGGGGQAGICGGGVK